MGENTIKINQLTFTRFLAATAIVIFHYGKFVPPFNGRFLSKAFDNANICVSYFFVLSGFIMVIAYHPLKKVDFKKYYINRLSRIYPVYLLALLLTVFFALSVSAVEFPGFSLQLFLLHGWAPEYTMSYNFPGWSLSVEAFFYILFPLLYNLVYAKFRLKNIIISVMAFWLAMQIGFFLLSIYQNVVSFIPISGGQRTNFLFYFPFFHLNEFLAGNAAGLFFLKIKSGNINYPKRIINAVTCLILILFCMVFFIPNIKAYTGINLHNGLLAVIFIPLILWLSLSKGNLAAILSSRPLIFLGDISYEMYILQFPVFSILANLKFKAGNTAFFYDGLLVLIAISAVCHLFIEKPLLRLIRKYS